MNNHTIAPVDQDRRVKNRIMAYTADIALLHELEAQLAEDMRRAANGNAVALLHDEPEPYTADEAEDPIRDEVQKEEDRERRAAARSRQVARAEAIHAELVSKPVGGIELNPWPTDDDPADPDLAFPSIMRSGIYPDYWSIPLGGVLPDLVEAVAAHAKITPRVIFKEIVRRAPTLTGTQSRVLLALADRAGERLQRAWPWARTLGLDCGFGEGNAKRDALKYVRRLEANKWVRAIPTYDVSGDTPNLIGSHYALSVPYDALDSIPATAIKGMRDEIAAAIREVR